MNITDPQVKNYISSLSPETHPKLAEMEALGYERDFPIIGPDVGRVLYQYTKLLNARRIFELGSGFGYSAFWFAMALPDDGELICSEASQNNVDLAEDYLQVAGLLHKVKLNAGDALKILQQHEGPFDIIFNDVDKEYYPEVFEIAVDKLRTGGLLISDNALFQGRVLAENPDPTAKSILVYNEAVFNSELFWTTILPIRDGLAVSLKLDNGQSL